MTYLYNAVDGIFVGQGVGHQALGAVNIGVPFITFVVAAAAMFSTKRTEQANMIAMSRGIVLKEAAIFALPLLFGPSFIWAAPFVAELVTLAFAITLSKRTKIIYQ